MFRLVEFVHCLGRYVFVFEIMRTYLPFTYDHAIIQQIIIVIAINRGRGMRVLMLGHVEAGYAMNEWRNRLM